MINVAIIGMGAIGNIRADIIQRSKKSQLVARSDIDLSKSTATVQQILDDNKIDAVVIATPTKYHLPLVHSALQAGKHVLCEKPLGRTVNEAEKMLEVVQPGKILHVGFNYRHLAHVQFAKKLIKLNFLGDLMFFRCKFGNGGRPNYQQAWCTQKDLSGGGVVIEQAIHVFDLVSFLFGRPYAVVASTNLCFHDFPDTEDNVFCMIKTSSGMAAIHVSWTQWHNIFELEIFGTRGYVRLTGRDGSYGPPRLFYGVKNDDHSRPEEREIVELLDKRSSWELDWAEFEDEIELGKNILINRFVAQQVVEAVYESAKSNEWISI